MAAVREPLLDKVHAGAHPGDDVLGVVRQARHRLAYRRQTFTAQVLLDERLTLFDHEHLVEARAELASELVGKRTFQFP